MIGIFQKKIDNSTAITYKLLKLLGVRANKVTIHNLLTDHPAYPSLLTISDCLNELKVRNTAYNVSREKYQSGTLRFPFIAHSKVNGGEFLLVQNIGNGIVTYSDGTKDQTLTEEKFLKVWSGVILIAQKTDESAEPNYWDNYIKEKLHQLRYPLMFGLMLGTILLVLNGAGVGRVDYLLMLTLKVIGIGVCSLLLVSSITANNPMIARLCSIGNMNCNDILSSDAAKVTAWLSWSEVGFYYFSGTFLWLLVDPSSLNVIRWLNLLSLPFTVYSLSYQARYKSWCFLCCAVQALLTSEFLVSLFFQGLKPAFTEYLSFNSTWLIKGFLCLLLPASIWSFLKPLLMSSAQEKPLKDQLKRFKFNIELFDQSIKSQPHIEVPANLMPITLGNPYASKTVTLVSNPFCKPCSEAHAFFDELIESRKDIKVDLVFYISDDDMAEKFNFVNHSLSLFKNSGIPGVRSALNSWYNNRRAINSWKEDHPSIQEEFPEIIMNQMNWYVDSGFIATPTVLVDGYKLSDPYRIEDLKHLIF